MAHVFISYVHENEVEAQRLADELTERGLSVWLDKNMIKPGSRWQDAIAEAIDGGDFFVACFSKEYNKKNESYMNKEIGLAIERLSNMPHAREWFIPAVFSGTVPKWRIGGGETLHDIQWVELNEANWDRGIQQIFQTIQPPRRLRSEATDNLSEEAVKSMLQEQGFFDVRQHWVGRGLLHQYEEIKRQGQKLVIDHSTGLTWQQSGSPETMTFKEAQKYIQKLRDKKHAGYSDWRLPTLEEAMSLMEPKKSEHGLYLDRFFDQTQVWIWTEDKKSAPSTAWFVLFNNGYCSASRVFTNNYVRAVR